ncbi:MAG TPA: sulfate adenylyltransferase subunit CysN [Polyangiaceae bacterium]|nr:sulfate adenylyltransferase subunit CysN [Polyangiaceae bacterium]
MSSEIDVTPENIERYLEQHQKKELLRFVSVGSVDDGKSTLIGRLLHDTKGVYEDQLSAVKKASSKGEMEIDFSLFTDGLRAEREQGITIDVAYRYFSTDRRKFIIADTPGHEQYTRNMATGASTANVAIILIDARLGVLPQSRRHAFIASLLGIPHLLVAVNKLDLENYSQAVFDRISKDFAKVAEKLAFKDVTFVPISAKLGDNVVHSSANTPWYKGPTLLSFLETVPIDADRNQKDFRFPVQYVVRPNLDYRGFAGEVASGVVKQGDTVTVLPSRKTSRVVAIDTYSGALPHAGPSRAVTLRLEHEIDISRGDMLVHGDNLPEVTRRFEANVVWLSERELDINKSYLLKHTTRMVRVNVERVLSTMDLSALESKPASSLRLNDIGQVRLQTHSELFFDPYVKNRNTGAFILIDSLTNNTVAAGMISGPVGGAADALTRGALESAGSQVSQRERQERLGQTGAVVWIDGPAAAGFATALERIFFDRGRMAAVVDAGVGSGASIGASSPAELAAHLASAGLWALVSSPTSAEARARVQASLGPKRGLEVSIGAELRIAGAVVETPSRDEDKLAALVADTLAKQLDGG